mmetsp:Transcript_5244/g.7968  ORF Transcript_5244/g.7968 Transcript_5244/m.7968 type:complete len:666 (+) Transcript_5244:76-2073(+)
MASSLKLSQLKAVNRMLAFNNESIEDDVDDTFRLPPAGSSHNQWKILIYDVACRSIISPLMSVSQLRKRGVTLHLLLDSEREPIPDVPAIYFIRPTKENLAIVAQDCAKGLYARTHLNFVTKLDRSLMEDFARLVVQSGSLENVASVHDQYLDFTCLEQKLFSLSKKNSYVLYNSTTATEQSMEHAMNEIAYGLFSVVATRGQVPIIRCPKGGAPEMVARKLNRMIAEHPTMLRSQNHSRPLLVIMDRNSDLVTPVQHTSTYQALIDDVLKHNANRVEFEVKVEQEGGGRPKILEKKYDLDADEDPFYKDHKFQPFPEAIEQNGVELQDVTEREQAIRSKTVSQQQVQQHTEGVDSSSLATAVDSLPALLDRKKQLEIHTSILQAVMNQVAARDVPQFYELESSLATGVYKNDLPKAQEDVLALVEDPSKGNVEDKLRLVIVYCLASTTASSDIDAVVEALQKTLETKGVTDKNAPTAGGATHGLLSKEDRQKLASGLQAIHYLRKLRSMHMITTMASSEFQETTTTSSGGDSTDMLSSFMARATNQASGLLAKATDKVSSMLGKIHKHRATQVVENLCEMKPNSEDEEYLYLDPKVKGDVDVTNMLRGMARAPVRDVIAFMIGGGCYAEYQNLQMVANEGRTVSYGSTELVDSCEFLAQLGQVS